MPNLIQNPSFETGLLNWKYVNVGVASDLPFEGSAVARMGPGVSTLFQDIFVAPLGRASFRLSFAVAAPEGLPGNLTVSVQWLDECCRVLSTGANLFIPSVTLFEEDGWLTYTAVTEFTPPYTAFARVLFNKMAGGNETDFVDVDLVSMNVV